MLVMFWVLLWFSIFRYSPVIPLDHFDTETFHYEQKRELKAYVHGGLKGTMTTVYNLMVTKTIEFRSEYIIFAVNNQWTILSNAFDEWGVGFGKCHWNTNQYYIDYLCFDGHLITFN